MTAERKPESVLGVVCALRREKPRGARGAAIVVARPGRDNAARAAEQLADTRNLKGLISFGYAGALAPHLRLGDVVVDTCVPQWRALAERHAMHGRIITVDRVIRSVDERRRLARETAALAVDMESDAVARVAAARGLPFAAVRAVTDTPHRDLSINWDLCRRPNGTFSTFAALRQAIASSQAIAELAQLWYASRLASKHLRLFLVELLAGDGTLR